MTRIDSVRQLLKSAEAGLRDLGAEAAKAGHYDDVILIADVAKRLNELAVKFESVGCQVSATASDSMSPAFQNEVTCNFQTTKSEANQLRNGAVKPRRRVGRASRKNGYPRFVRRGDDLVKIGWSKGAAKEYQHKAPRGVLLAVAQSLREKAPNGQILSTEDFLPSEQPGSGEEIPAYQAYVCLAWLRSTGLVDQSGRQGYSLTNGASLSQRIDEAWSRLPSK